MRISSRLVGTGVVWVLVCAVLAAADFWEERAFTSWSAQEVERMLTDSPWSRQVTVMLRDAAGPTEGVVVGAGGDGDGGARPAPQNIGRAALRARVADYLQARRIRSNPGPSRITVTVSWRSALPVKQAVARAQAGLGAPISAAQEAFLVQQEPLYVVSVAGIPRPLAEGIARQVLLAATTLVRKDKQPIVAEDVEAFFDSDETVILEFAFLRDDPITLLDKDVEFLMKLGETEVKRRFKLEDMVYGSDLSL